MTFAVAVRRHNAAVQLGEMANDRQAETEPPEAARRRAVTLAEAIKHVRKKVLVDALAGVGNDQLGLPFGAPDDDVHLAAQGRELDRVRQQVPEDLLQAIRIAMDPAVRYIDRRLQPDLFGGGRRFDGIDSGVDDAFEVHRGGR